MDSDDYERALIRDQQVAGSNPAADAFDDLRPCDQADALRPGLEEWASPPIRRSMASATDAVTALAS